MIGKHNGRSNTSSNTSLKINIINKNLISFDGKLKDSGYIMPPYFDERFISFVERNSGQFSKDLKRLNNLKSMPFNDINSLNGDLHTRISFAKNQYNLIYDDLLVINNFMLRKSNNSDDPIINQHFMSQLSHHIRTASTVITSTYEVLLRSNGKSKDKDYICGKHNSIHTGFDYFDKLAQILDTPLEPLNIERIFYRNLNDAMKK